MVTNLPQCHLHAAQIEGCGGDSLPQSLSTISSTDTSFISAITICFYCCQNTKVSDLYFAIRDWIGRYV
jgi:hypothetical protein